MKSDSESEKDYEERSQAMKAADLSFGAGNRVGIGRNMALMEMYKIIPTLLLKYKVKEQLSLEMNYANICCAVDSRGSE